MCYYTALEGTRSCLFSPLSGDHSVPHGSTSITPKSPTGATWSMTRTLTSRPLRPYLLSASPPPPRALRVPPPIHTAIWLDQHTREPCSPNASTAMHATLPNLAVYGFYATFSSF